MYSNVIECGPKYIIIDLGGLAYTPHANTVMHVMVTVTLQCSRQGHVHVILFYHLTNIRASKLIIFSWSGGMVAEGMLHRNFCTSHHIHGTLQHSDIKLYMYNEVKVASYYGNVTKNTTTI